MQRRHFIGSAFAGAGALALTPRRALAGPAASPFGALAGGSEVGEIELFQIEIDAPRQLSGGTWRNRQGAVLRLGAAGQSGWSEWRMGTNAPDVDAAAWGAWLGELGGLSIPEALSRVTARHRTGVWESGQAELAETALLDLGGRLLGRPTVHLLGLGGIEPVPGLPAVLSTDPEHVATAAAAARQAGTPFKLKLFGDLDEDVQLAQTARAHLGPDLYLLGDPNEAYGRGDDRPVEEALPLVPALVALRDAGLDGIEDPAALTVAAWVALQEAVGPLDLVPDYPLRPAARAVWDVRPEMAQLFNLHPCVMGSLADAVALGRRVQSFGARVMIGDDSFVGPGCTVWQQLAVGLGAVWVEALEKPAESGVFLRCVTSQPTVYADGRTRVVDWRPGFGLDVDVPRLRQTATAAVRF